MSKPAE